MRFSYHIQFLFVFTISLHLVRSAVKKQHTLDTKIYRPGRNLMYDELFMILVPNNNIIIVERVGKFRIFAEFTSFQISIYKISLWKFGIQTAPSASVVANFKKFSSRPRFEPGSPALQSSYLDKPLSQAKIFPLILSSIPLDHSVVLLSTSQLQKSS